MTKTARPYRAHDLPTLENTVQILQSAHDHIESVTFDIDIYGSHGQGPCCYIGAIQSISSPEPKTIAYKAIDLVALKKIKAGTPIDRRKDIYNEARARSGENPGSGRIAEALGFGSMTYASQDGALSLFREAIRDVCTEVELKREAEAR